MHASSSPLCSKHQSNKYLPPQHQSFCCCLYFYKIEKCTHDITTIAAWEEKRLRGKLGHCASCQGNTERRAWRVLHYLTFLLVAVHFGADRREEDSKKSYPSLPALPERMGRTFGHDCFGRHGSPLKRQLVSCLWNRRMGGWAKHGMAWPSVEQTFICICLLPTHKEGGKESFRLF